MRTVRPIEPSGASCRDAIIARSRERYYEPIEVIRRQVETQRHRWSSQRGSTTPAADAEVEEEASYEEL